jgi:hypothetical protein
LDRTATPILPIIRAGGGSCIPVRVPEPDTFHEEIRRLAGQVDGGPDIVPDLDADIAGQYRERRAVLLRLLNVNATVASDAAEVSGDHPRLVGLRMELRDWLRSLLIWAREKGRL